MPKRRATRALLALIVITVLSFVVDQNTGDTTGPPYNDPLINKAAFFVFAGAFVLAVVAALVVVAGSVRRRMRQSGDPASSAKR